MSDSYLVRSKEGAREQGPFSFAVVEESVQAERLNEACQVRPADGGEWIPFVELRRQKKQLRDDRSAAATAAVERAAEVNAKRTSSTQLVIGLLVLVVGIGASVLSRQTAEPGSTYFVFRGLVILGMVLMIRSQVRKR